MTAQDEAIENLSATLADLGSDNHDLKAILQRGYQVSNLLGWTDARDWLYRELDSYPDLDSVPDHRRVPGKTSPIALVGLWHAVNH